MGNLFKAALAFSLATILTTSPAFALTHEFAPFNVLASGPASTPQSLALVGAPAATYNGYTISLNWSAGANNPQSFEAVPGLVSQAAPNQAGATFYADPGPAPMSTFSGTSRALSWGGYFDTNYVGGNPLHFWYVQNFIDSTANWNNVAVTLFSVTTQTSNALGNTSGQPTWRRPNTPNDLSNNGTAVPFQVVPFTVDTSGPYVITTNTSGAAGYDGFLGVYASAFSPTDQLNNIVALNDDFVQDDATRSGVSVALTSSTQYFLVQTGFNNGDFGAWTGTIVGPGIATVPEPAFGILSLTLIASSVLRPRRREPVVKSGRSA